MLATSVVDPLLTSPQRTRRHDDDMATLQKSLQLLPSLNLPWSSAAVSIAASSLTLSHRQEEGPELSMEAAAKNEKEAEPQQGEEDVAYNDTKEDSGAEKEDDDHVDTAFQQLMNRGNYLRQLRLLALADEQERQAQTMFAETSFCEEKKEDFDDDDDIPAVGFAAAEQELDDDVRILPNQEKVLDYNSYLAHQRYYDDLKHVDIKYMDFGNIGNPSGNEADGDQDRGRLVVEQRKRLGKGGLCWDAAFVLGEHVIAHEKEWNDTKPGRKSAVPKVVELGAGTGLCGMMIAKATESRVEVTDLPELEDLMRDNIELNFEGGRIHDAVTADDGSSTEKLILGDDQKKAKGTISSRVLRWGVEEDYEGAPYDVIIGADIVTSLYDPVALAQTLHALSGPDTRIYISGKARLDKPHEEFDTEMNCLFGRVRKIERPSSTLRSPNVFIIVAEGKR